MAKQNKRPDPPSEEDLRLEQTRQRLRKLEGAVDTVDWAHRARHDHTEMVKALVRAPGESIEIRFPNPADENDPHVLKFDAASGQKFKVLLSTILEAQALRLELDFHQALQAAENK